MKSKYELTISTNYVPHWTYIEALRELFQNAVDNETTNPENKMLFEFTGDSIKICNKSSILELSTLLLGSTTKADDEKTIGQHGEGYKIAFVVLLREGKTVTVYNYGKREIWSTKLVKSKRFGGELVPCIVVEKEAVWKKVPDHDLTIAVGNITKEEYKEVVSKNLHLRDYNSFNVKSSGEILLDKEETGNVYVGGLYVTNTKELAYGYNFLPQKLSLDRDRAMVKGFELYWETSVMWREASTDARMNIIMTTLANNNKADVKSLVSLVSYHPYGEREANIVESVIKRFKESHGENSIPVTDANEYEEIKKRGGKPVITTSSIRSYYDYSSYKDTDLQGLETIKMTTVEKLEKFLTKVSNKLSYEEEKELKEIIEELKERENE